MPDSFDEHVKLMFDLQALAFASDMTRVFSFKMGRDASSRVVSGERRQHRLPPASHHGEREDRDPRVREDQHATTSACCRTSSSKLKNTPDGDGNLLDNTLIIYGSPMGDSNVHNHKRCPLFLAGHAGGTLKGNLHIKAPDGTPMANAMLTLLHKLGLDDMKQFGDSTRRVRSEQRAGDRDRRRRRRDRA